MLKFKNLKLMFNLIVSTLVSNDKKIVYVIKLRNKTYCNNGLFDFSCWQRLRQSF